MEGHPNNEPGNTADRIANHPHKEDGSLDERGTKGTGRDVSDITGGV